MDQNKITEIIRRATEDAEFRTSLQAETQAALSDYGLSTEDIQTIIHLLGLDAETSTTELEGRLSRAGVNLDVAPLEGVDGAETEARIKVRFPWLTDE